MTVGVDVGGRKIAIVSHDAGVFASYELKKIDYPRFRKEARAWLEGYVGFLEDPHWVMEAPVVAGVRNLQSTIRVAQTFGLVACVVPGVEEVAVSSWKKATVGNGNASKLQVRQWLDDKHPVAARMCRGNQDLYDAACIALYGERLRNS